METKPGGSLGLAGPASNGLPGPWLGCLAEILGLRVESGGKAGSRILELDFLNDALCDVASSLLDAASDSAIISDACMPGL